MLRTNSKKANENIRAYIMGNFTPENYTEDPPKDFPGVAAFILGVFRTERKHILNGDYYRKIEFAIFTDWCKGLPSVLDTCYYYNRSAVDDLGRILEATAEEKARFSGPEAEDRLTWLIYREISKGAAKQAESDSGR